mmetsp:Transcript_104656/g.302862  ORF Transcript_104656/g.302862 Transcript_104656/m.302862 type:complete len:456 (+) Transcript_104656:138-1505(+)
MGSASSSSSSRRGNQPAAEEPAAAEQSAGSEADGAVAMPESLSQGYEELVNAIIRPPRMKYNPEHDLGPAKFSIGGRRFIREDLELANNRGDKLACSWWKIDPQDAPAQQLPCVVYLHGNAGCRLAAHELLEHLLPSSVSVFALDFSGSGVSGGEYVSLGFFEREDVAAVIEHLRKSGEVSTVGLWGHSMGAVTALLYGDRDPSIAGMVLDSGFADLMQLINELGQNFREQIPLPGFAISVAVGMIRRSVRRRANFDPREVNPLANCDKSFIPALFAHGEKDNFIKPSHSEQLHNAYMGDKNLVIFDGDHNSPRPEFLFGSAVIFLRQTLGVKDEHCLDPMSPLNGGFDRNVFQSAAAAVRQSEEEMMRQAMMLSMADANGQAAPQNEVPVEAIRAGVASFRDVTGVGGTSALYYVEAALSAGGTVDHAIQQYFDCGCAAPPSGWQPRRLELSAL